MCSQLYSNGYSNGSNFILSDLKISIDNINYVDTVLTADLNEKFIIDVNNITVTEL